MRKLGGPGGCGLQTRAWQEPRGALKSGGIVLDSCSQLAAVGAVVVLAFDVVVVTDVAETTVAAADRAPAAP